MPDSFDRDRNNDAPLGWSEAFAALPMETPPADGWARVVQQLDAPARRRGRTRRERRTSWMLGLASAAVLAVAAWSPLSRWLDDADASSASTPAVAVQEAPGVRGPAAALQAGPRPEPLQEQAGAPGDAVASASVGTTDKPAPVATREPPRAAIAKPRNVAANATPDPGTIVQRNEIANDSALVAAADASDPLRDLKTQSAQLEALVALARDDRVGSASGELLSAELDAGIAMVDAALSQPDLDAARRQELWRERVDLLQQLAGMEATSRWLAAQGASNSTLVSVQ